MANVPHSGLTGADLHEPKGADAANANEVYVADGAGSGDWTTIGNSSLASTAKAFQAQLLHVRDEKASGTDAGTFTAGDWRTRTLNTSKTNEISGASLSSNQITLPAGTYMIMASAPAFGVTEHLTRFRNITDGTTTVVGTAGYSADDMSHSFCNGRFTIAAQKVFELQHRGFVTITNGFGESTNFGEVEVYAEVMIWKVG